MDVLMGIHMGQRQTQIDGPCELGLYLGSNLIDQRSIAWASANQVLGTEFEHTAVINKPVNIWTRSGSALREADVQANGQLGCTRCSCRLFSGGHCDHQGC